MVMPSAGRGHQRTLYMQAVVDKAEQAISLCLHLQELLSLVMRGLLNCLTVHSYILGFQWHLGTPNATSLYGCIQRPTSHRVQENRFLKEAMGKTHHHHTPVLSPLEQLEQLRRLRLIMAPQSCSLLFYNIVTCFLMSPLT